MEVVATEWLPATHREPSPPQRKPLEGERQRKAQQKGRRKRKEKNRWDPGVATPVAPKESAPWGVIKLM